MAQEYIKLNETNENGILALNSSVFDEIAELSVNKVSDCYLSKQGKSVNVKINKDKLILNINVKLKQNINVQNVCEQLQNKIYDNIFQTTEIKVSQININVVGFIGEK